MFYDTEPGPEEAGEPKFVVLVIGLNESNWVWIGGEEHKL